MSHFFCATDLGGISQVTLDSKFFWKKRKFLKIFFSCKKNFLEDKKNGIFVFVLFSGYIQTGLYFGYRRCRRRRHCRCCCRQRSCLKLNFVLHRACQEKG